ncbi:hypothetical protein [Jannaschia sp. W003]|uniref:hypothetical protein n=1 Tax=Jannaschia sp. W003 TaxID=2867012 RepID=UPI0021A5EF98|nr:hypothetical protein [Jannaschia sp. W003]UWQ19978.1 hypothetical protein K3554_08075 [Jannaschia sp. W003]
MGIHSLRYPGGSLTEKYFRITDPNNTAALDDRDEPVELVPISDFFAYAADTGKSVTMVLPTRQFLSESADKNGDRFIDIPVEDLRGFVRDVMTGRYGKVEIDAFEIGNEYWGAGEMTAVEYGRLSSAMTRIVGGELKSLENEHGGDFDVDIIAQAGTNFSYSNLSEGMPEDASPDEILELLGERYDREFGDEFKLNSGSVNWRLVNDQLIRDEFNPREYDILDGLVSHLYSEGQVNPTDRHFGLDQLKKTWDLDEGGKSIHVTEWNSSAKSTRLSPDDDYGLHQAHEMLNVVEAMMSAGVEQAHVWPLLHKTTTALSEGAAHDGLSPAGEMFQMMMETLPGKMMLDFTPKKENVTELVDDDCHVHGFYGAGEIILYIASDADGMIATEIDISSMVRSGGEVNALVLGVTEGSNPGSSKSAAQVEELTQGDVYEDGILSVVLDPGEIMQVEIRDFVATEDFKQIAARIDGVEPAVLGADEVAAIQGGDGSSDNILDAISSDAPAAFPPDEEEVEDDEVLVDDDGGGLGMLLGLLPLLLLGAMFAGG